MSAFPAIVIIVPPPVHTNTCHGEPGCVTYGEMYPWLGLFPIAIVLAMVIWGVWALLSWLVDVLRDWGQRRSYRRYR